jgi:hypothetical protein
MAEKKPICNYEGILKELQTGDTLPGGSGLVFVGVKTSAYTASVGEYVPANTTSAAWTLTLPASPTLGDVVCVVDYAGTFNTNNLTVGRNGLKINGASEDLVLDVDDTVVVLRYLDATEGWKVEYMGPSAVGTASEVVYDPATSGLTATTVQAAVDEVVDEYVPKTLFDANTILAANSDNTPAALTIGASTLVGRTATGNIAALTPAEAFALFTPPITYHFYLQQRLGTETRVHVLTSLGSGVVLAGTVPTGQIYKSTDSGATWTLVQRLGTETYVFSLASLGSGVVLAGTHPTGQIYKSTDSGATWTLVQRLGTETYVFSLASLGSGVVLAGTYPTGQIYTGREQSAW